MFGSLTEQAFAQRRCAGVSLTQTTSVTSTDQAWLRGEEATQASFIVSETVLRATDKHEAGEEEAGG